MNDKEKKAIEKIEKQILIGECEKAIGVPIYISDLKIVLNLIKNQKAEIEKKDKIIDLMAEESVKTHEWFYSEFDDYTKEDFIKYFENKAEEDK